MTNITRYKSALANLDARINVKTDRDAANWLCRYLFGNPQDGNNRLYKAITYHRHFSLRFAPPADPWRLQARTDALEALCKLPTSLLKSLIVGGIPLAEAGRRATVTAHETGDAIAPDVAAFWRQE